ncbi:MAG: polysaccharide deacetylase family protein [Bacteroidales bacterium]
MKGKFPFFASLLFTGIMIKGYGQVVEAPYEVATWKGFTEAAITYTFDDNTSNQYAIAIPMFNEFGFQATFFPVINWSPNWTDFQNAVNEGHEIGSHTVSHPHLQELSDSMQNEELKNSKDEIDANITGQVCRTIAYPYCEPSIDTITSKYYIAARHCQGNIENTTPNDFLNISSIVCGTEGNIITAADFSSNADSAAMISGWSVYLLHGIDSDGGYSPVTSDDLRGSLEYLDDNSNKFWVSGFGNVVRYIRERNAVSVTGIDVFTDSLHVELTDTLDNDTYDYPVSIRRPLPENWPYAQAFQNGDSVETQVVETGSVKYIVIHAVPDEGIVTVKSAEAPEEPVSSIQYQNRNTRIMLMPNPFENEITIQADGQFSYSIYAMDGKLMELEEGFLSAQTGSSLAPGIYLLRVQDRSGNNTLKMLKK